MLPEKREKVIFFRLRYTAVFTAVFFIFIMGSCQTISGVDEGYDKICGVCGKELYNKFVLADGKKYHPDCFREKIELKCSVCEKPVHGAYARDNQGVYHEDCFREYRLEKCIICGLPVDGEHIVDSWGQSAHFFHHDQKALLCESCGRILSTSSKGGVKYPDGRMSCGICRETAVVNEKQIPAIRKEVANVLGSVGIGPVSKEITVKLVDRSTLIRESRGSDKDNTRGFTKTLRLIEMGRTVSAKHSIYILYGLPLLEFKGVLAHEMIHVWLNESDIKMPSMETEGFCNLGIMLVNEKDRSDFARVLQDQLEHSEDEIYGDGYRLMKFRLDQIGWQGLIQLVRLNSPLSIE